MLVSIAWISVGQLFFDCSPTVYTALGFVIPSNSEDYPAPRVCCTLNIKPFNPRYLMRTFCSQSHES